jgi:hypothetical protein
MAAVVLAALSLTVPAVLSAQKSDAPAAEEVAGVAGATDASEAPVSEYAGHVGYYVREDEVVFVFERALYEAATRGDTGERVAVADIKLDDSPVVAVAGEFNDWSKVAWKMETVKPGVYELRRPLAEFEARDSWPFKFVVDGMLWIEPPANASNAVPTGLGNDSFNLALNLSEYEANRAAELTRGRGACSAPQGAPGTTEGTAASDVDAPAEDAPQGYGVITPELELVDSPLLESLNLPESQMKEGWGFKPVEQSGGAPIPVAANPMITSDQRVIGFISVFVIPPTVEEQLAWDEAEHLQEDGGTERMMAMIAQRAPAARAAYVAIYESAPGGPETGVFALEFSEPLLPERREELAQDGPGGAVLAGERVAAAVWSDDPDRSCMDAVRAHVASVLGE